MSKTLAKILGHDETAIAKAVSEFEELCGFPSEDVRLIAENKQRLRSKIEQLGLDADDTTDRELYYALRARFDRDAKMLDKALGVNEGTKLEERINKAVQLINHSLSTDEAWVVKTSFARSALTKNPPKQVAKLLRYRSVASMLKREDPAEIFLTGSFVESATWRRSISKQLAKPNAAQYELRPLKVINLKPDRWGNLDGPDSHIVADKHLGVVALWPSEDLNNAPVLCLTLLLLAGVQSLNPSGYGEALHELSPALHWWADSNHLISDHKRPVSLNLKDISLNHLKNHDFKDAVRHHGALSLWNELTGRYQKISKSLSEVVPDINYNFSQNNQMELPTSAELAEEYAKAE